MCARRDIGVESCLGMTWLGGHTIEFTANKWSESPRRERSLTRVSGRAGDKSAGRRAFASLLPPLIFRFPFRLPLPHPPHSFLPSVLRFLTPLRPPSPPLFPPREHHFSPPATASTTMRDLNVLANSWLPAASAGLEGGLQEFGQGESRLARRRTRL